MTPPPPQKKTLSISKSTLATYRESVERKFGTGSAYLLNDDDIKPVEVIPSGLPPLDIALGIGGLPRGRIVEVFGPEMCVDGDTFIQFQVRRADETRINSKGGTIRRLYERFHGIPSTNDRGKYLQSKKFADKFYAPSLNEAGRIFQNRIIDVVSTGKKMCYELKTLSGRKIVTTAEHLFLGKREFFRLEDLSPGMIVMTSRAHNRLHAVDQHNNLRFMATEDVVKAVRPIGKRETFDLCMKSPSNNYVANNFIVHNSGKTTLALTFVAQAQKLGENVHFIDAEHSLDLEYAKKIGVNLDTTLISQPDYGEQALSIAELAVQSKVISVVVIDSVAALVPKSEVDGEFGDPQMGIQARLMSQAMRKLTAISSQNNCTVIFINQLRMKIGITWGSNETTSGGQALKFYSSIRLDTRKTSLIKHGEDVVGQMTRIKVLKNKLAPPFKECELPLIYGEGFDVEGCIFDMAVDKGIIDKAGAWYSYKGEQVGQGAENSKKFLKDHREIFEAVKSQVCQKSIPSRI